MKLTYTYIFSVWPYKRWMKFMSFAYEVTYKNKLAFCCLWCVFIINVHLRSLFWFKLTEHTTVVMHQNTDVIAHQQLHFNIINDSSFTTAWHCNARSSADAEGPPDAPHIRNITLKRHVIGNDFQGHSRSLQFTIAALDRPYIISS